MHVFGIEAEKFVMKCKNCSSENITVRGKAYASKPVQLEGILGYDSRRSLVLSKIEIKCETCSVVEEFGTRHSQFEMKGILN